MAFEDSATLGAVDRYQQTVRASAPWLPNNVDFIQRINGLSQREQVRDILFDASYLILRLGTSTSVHPARCRSIRAIAC